MNKLMIWGALAVGLTLGGRALADDDDERHERHERREHERREHGDWRWSPYGGPRYQLEPRYQVEPRYEVDPRYRLEPRYQVEPDWRYRNDRPLVPEDSDRRPEDSD